MKTIVALVDLSEGTNTVIEHAKDLALAFHSELVLLHVLTPQPVVVDIGFASPTMYLEPSGEQWNAHQKKLIEIRQSLEADGVLVTAEQFQGVPIDKIQPECHRLHADLIVMGSHHLGALQRLLRGSVSRDVLRQANCPVLVIPIGKPLPQEVAAAAM